MTTLPRPVTVLLDDGSHAAQAIRALLTTYGHRIETRMQKETLDTLTVDALAALLAGLTTGGACVAMPLTANAAALAEDAAHVFAPRLYAALAPLRVGLTDIMLPFINATEQDIAHFLAAQVATRAEAAITDVEATVEQAVERVTRTRNPRGVGKRTTKAQARRDTSAETPEPQP